MAIKRDGTVARPGVHLNVMTGKDEVITWEELKRAVQFQNRIPMVLDHPVGGYIDPNNRIGTVTQTVNEKEKKIDGEFWFFDEPECWDQIPHELKKRILNKKADINMSAGYKVGPLVEGRQTSRHYDHIALDVKNPMFVNIGIEKGDVRMESKLPDNFRIEETPVITGEKDKEEKEVPKTEPHDPLNIGILMGEMKAELKAQKEVIDSLHKQLTKPAVEETTEETRPEPEPTHEPEPPKPKTVIPQGSASKEDGPDDDGVFRIVVGRKKEK